MAVFWKTATMTVIPSRPSPTHSMPVTAPVRKATRSAPGILPSRAAAAVRTLPRTAMLMPMKPVSPDIVAPPRKHSTRKAPAEPKVSATDLSGRTTWVAVKKMRMASGSRMIPMARNWRRQEGLRTLLDGLGDGLHGGGALVGAQHAAHQDQPHDDAEDGRRERHGEPGLLGAGEDEGLVPPFSREEVGHRVLLPSVGPAGSRRGPWLRIGFGQFSSWREAAPGAATPAGSGATILTLRGGARKEPPGTPAVPDAGAGAQSSSSASSVSGPAISS